MIETDKEGLARHNAAVVSFFLGILLEELHTAVAPVAYQVILVPGIGQFREFESPRVHTRTNSCTS